MKESKKRVSHKLLGIPSSRSIPYKRWRGMINRCDNKNLISYRYYGGRGITYENNWSTFFGFWKDMGNSYLDNLSLDRIDNNGNYCKENCRWTDLITQNNNRSNNRILTYNRESHTVSEWGRKLNVNPNRIHTRIYRGWTVSKIIETQFVPCPQRRNHKRI